MRGAVIGARFHPSLPEAAVLSSRLPHCSHIPAMRSSTLCLLALIAVILACALFPAEARLREGECEGQQTDGRVRGLLAGLGGPAVCPVRLCRTIPHSVWSCVRRCVSVCLKRMGEFGKSLGGLKDEEAIHNGIRKACKTFTDKADKRFVRRHTHTHTQHRE